MDYTVAEIEAASETLRLGKKTITYRGKTYQTYRGMLILTIGSGKDKRRRQLTKTFTYDEAHTEGQANKAVSKWHRDLIDEAKARVAKAEAEAKAREEAEKAREEAEKHPKWTLPDYAADVLRRSPADPSSKTGYRTQLHRLEEAFGGVMLEDLTADMVADWMDSLSKRGLSPVTVRNARAFLNMVMRYAMEEDGLITANPCKKHATKPPKLPHKEPNALGAAERGKVLDYLENAPYRPVTLASLIALLTGMRVGEVCGLRWMDVDLDRGIIHVRNTIGVKEGGTYQKEPKTGASLRDIPIPSQLSDALKVRRADMWAERIATVKTTAEEFGELFVIGKADGSYCHPGVVSRDWRAIAEVLQLRGTQNRRPTFHDLRHTFITAAITDIGADVKTVASMAGHSKVSHTLDIYASSDPDAKARLAAAIDDVLASEREAARAERLRAEEEASKRGQVIRLGNGTEG